MKCVLAPISLLFLVTSLPALQVDPVMGNDQNDGVSSPVKSIARAVKLVKAGDTLHLAPGTYHESLELIGKSGLPGQPITVDGHGAILDGSEPLKAAEWEALGGGLFRKIKLIPKMDAAILSRWFFLWNGQMNRMGRMSKAPGAALKKVEELQVNEWTYVQAEDAFYLKLPEGQDLAAANIRYPLRSNAVAIYGRSSHVVVKNFTGTHVYNDGFNLHSDLKDIVFENIAAIECGDDGLSAHEAAECRIDGFVSIGNSTGLCDTVSSVTHYRNVFISRCVSADIYFIGDSPHSMENVLVESLSVFPLLVSHQGSAEPISKSRVSLKNVQIHRITDLPGEVRVHRHCYLEVDHCTFNGLNWLIAGGGEATVSHSVITGGAKKPNLVVYQEAKWKGTANHYDIATLRAGPKLFKPETFSEFQTLHDGDVGSRWSADKPEAGVGADRAGLEKLRR